MKHLTAYLMVLATFPAQDSSSVLSKKVPEDAGSSEAPLLLCIGMHIEPHGLQQGRGYKDAAFFRRHAADIRTVADLVEAHHGKLTIQAQTPFTQTAVETGDKILGEMEKRGHEVGLHFHEDAHLGRAVNELPAERWTAEMKEQIEWIRKAGAENIRYWSGGNLYPDLLKAAQGAKLSVMGDYKNPKNQQSDSKLLTVFPWRPAKGPRENDVSDFAKHDAGGKIVYLPSGAFGKSDYAGKRRSEDAGGDAKYFDFLTEGLEASLRAARKDRVNVFHITVHAGEFKGRGNPFAVIAEWLTEVVDPLVRKGKVRWATFSEMADAFVKWEKEHPGVAPRETGMAAPRKGAGRITFVLNVHDWRNWNESADTLLQAISIFEKYRVQGDFYLTAQMAEVYSEKRPDVIRRLKESGMTISFHNRAPHPLRAGFDGCFRGLGDSALEKAVRDYETYRLDLTTGGLDKSRPGGYAYVAEVFGSPPVAVGESTSDRRSVAAAKRVYREMGAKVIVVYHERGTKIDKPFEFVDGLLVRPSDFSITRWKNSGENEEAFWWNRKDPNPLARLKEELAAWKGPRDPIVTALIHENNFYRFGPESWTPIYYTGRKKEPKQPPFDLDAQDVSRPRSKEEQEKIWAAYEALVAYAAEHLHVVTSKELAEAAEGR